MKRLLTIMLSALLLITCSACSIVPQGTNDSAGEKPSTDSTENVIVYETHAVPDTISSSAVNAIKDDKFQMGFNVLSTASSQSMMPEGSNVYGRAVQGYFDYNGTAKFVGPDSNLDRYGNGKRTRPWEITQWASKESLVDEQTMLPTKAPMVDGDTYTYYNDYKKVIVNPNSGMIKLCAYAGKEYEYKERSNKYLTENQWVHLLIEQTVTSYKFSEIKALTAYIDFKIDYMKEYSVTTTAGFEGAQAAQLIWYFTFQSPKGKMIWFGIPLFDNRDFNKPFIQAETVAWDKGTNTFIYSAAKDEYFSQHPQVGQRYRLTIPLTKSISRCYDYLKNNNLLKEGEYFGDFFLGGMNLGYELPGTIDMETTINQVGLYVVKAK